MFTGIVEEVGVVRDAVPRGNAREIRIAAPELVRGLREGESISVDGACQTVVAVRGGSFSVVAVGTTLSRTILGEYARGRRVNLERALALGERLGGHLVQGHVDGVGEVVGVGRKGEHLLLDFTLPEVVARVTILHGSIAVNGVSLTVNALPAPDRCQVALIPYTLEHTNLGGLRVGDRVNLEGDLIGKYVGKLLGPRPAGGRGDGGGRGGGLSPADLRDWGF